MICRRNSTQLLATLPPLLPLACVVILLSLSCYGCKSNAHTSDSSLQKIDEMLNVQLPQGAPRSRVEYFLNSRGYKIENSPDKTPWSPSYVTSIPTRSSLQPHV
jgi:hypothetical protein